MHIVIIGGGEVGLSLAEKMVGMGLTASIIEANKSQAKLLSAKVSKDITVVYGDGCDSSILQDAGIAEAEFFAAATGYDDVNLVACEVADKSFDLTKIVARINRPQNERIFAHMGIKTVSASRIIADIIEDEISGL